MDRYASHRMDSGPVAALPIREHFAWRAMALPLVASRLDPPPTRDWSAWTRSRLNRAAPNDV